MCMDLWGGDKTGHKIDFVDGINTLIHSPRWWDDGTCFASFKMLVKLSSKLSILNVTYLVTGKKQ